MLSYIGEIVLKKVQSDFIMNSFFQHYLEKESIGNNMINENKCSWSPARFYDFYQGQGVGLPLFFS